MICFNSGCSFTTPYSSLRDNEMYWYFLGKDLGCDQFINESMSGSSNNLIIQRVIKHLLKNPNLDVFYIINLTSLNRIDLESKKSDKLQDVLKPHDLARCNIETLELIAYTQIVGVVSLLKLYNKDFYIINNSENFLNNQWPQKDEFVNFVKNESRILNLYKWSKFDFHKNVSKIKPYDFDLYGWYGHDNQTGHYAYYCKLKEIIIERKNEKKHL